MTPQAASPPGAMRAARRRRGLPLVGLLLAACAAGCDEPRPHAAAPGSPLPGLTEGELGRFLLGRAVFERLATEEEGLGPLYNAERCSACHMDPAVGGTGRVLVTKATRWDAREGCDLLREEGGDNIQRLATPLLRAHGLGPERVPEAANGRSAVVSPPLYGLGLVEAVPMEALRALADPDDRDGDGVSGRVGHTADGRPGRFGRKAEAASLDEFVDQALRFELGFTTPETPEEEAVNGRPVPPGADPMPEPEIDARGVSLLADFVRFLAAPAPDRGASAAARDTLAAGSALFEEVGCAACHTPRLETADDAPAALASMEIAVYSDLLLHDMGPGLADVCGPDAAPGEYRTAPLWGLRYRPTLLHDGRATTPAEAVEHHGGEAAAARAAFRGLDPERRETLLRFLGSL